VADKEVKATKEGAGEEGRRAREVMDCRTKIAGAFERATGRPPPDTGHVEVWAAQGYHLPLCAAVVAEGLARKPDISTLQYFDGRIADAHQRRAGNGSEPAAKPASAEPVDRETALRRAFEVWLKYPTCEISGTQPGDKACPIPPELLLAWLIEAGRRSPDDVQAHVARAIHRVQARLAEKLAAEKVAAEERAG
jgi:hypothetical protein